jgi:hypothetical protein
MCIPYKFGLVGREVLEHQCRQVSIFSEMKQVLEVQGIDSVLGVVVYDLVGNEERFVSIGRSQAVHCEASRKTGDGSEQRFERFGEMVRDKVLVHLLDKHAGVVVQIK